MCSILLCFNLLLKQTIVKFSVYLFCIPTVSPLTLFALTNRFLLFLSLHKVLSYLKMSCMDFSN